MKHVIEPAFSLFIIAALVTALLGLVRNLTLEPIETQRKKTLEKTMKEVLSEAEDFRELNANIAGNPGGSMVRAFEGLRENETIGYVLELAPSGYSGTISIMVGISKTEEKITGMRVMKHTETPGLGSLAVKESFYRKFDGKKLVPIKVVRASPGDDEIEAITSATITTKAVTGAVNEAIEWFNGGLWK